MSLPLRINKHHPLTLDEAELDGELWRDLGDDVGGDVAGDERRVAHHVVDGVGHLHQLAVGQIWKGRREAKVTRMNDGHFKF